jgi:hypothetical protein
MTREANRRSKKPPIPPAPCHMVEIWTRDTLPCGVTVVFVTRLEPVSDAAWLGLSDLHPVLASAPAGRHREPRDRARSDAAGLDLEVRERRRQETRMVLAHVRDIPIDGVGGRIHRPLSGDENRCHPACLSPPARGTRIPGPATRRPRPPAGGGGRQG